MKTDDMIYHTIGFIVRRGCRSRQKLFGEQVGKLIVVCFFFTGSGFGRCLKTRYSYTNLSFHDHINAFLKSNRLLSNWDLWILTMMMMISLVQCFVRCVFWTLSYSTSKECLAAIETELKFEGKKSENESLDSIAERLKTQDSKFRCLHGSYDLKIVISILEGKLPECVDMGQVVILKLQINSCFLQWRRFLSHLSEFYTDVVIRKQEVSNLELDLVVEHGSAAILKALEDIDQSVLEAEASIKDLPGVIDVVSED